MSSFDIDVTRDGGCWTVHIREVNGPAQGQTISEAEWTARQMIALATGVPIDDIAVRSAGLAAQNGIPARWASSSSTRRFFSASVIGVRPRLKRLRGLGVELSVMPGVHRKWRRSVRRRKLTTRTSREVQVQNESRRAPLEGIG